MRHLLHVHILYISCSRRYSLHDWWHWYFLSTIKFKEQEIELIEQHPNIPQACEKCSWLSHESYFLTHHIIPRNGCFFAKRTNLSPWWGIYSMTNCLQPFPNMSGFVSICFCTTTQNRNWSGCKSNSHQAHNLNNVKLGWSGFFTCPSTRFVMRFQTGSHSWTFTISAYSVSTEKCGSAMWHDSTLSAQVISCSACPNVLSPSIAKLYTPNALLIKST